MDAKCLHNAKARWNTSRVCNYDCVYHREYLDHAAGVEVVMKEIAFTMHAAELFSQCCKFNATKCMGYLLGIAPNLIHMKASSAQGRLALSTALLYSSPITDDLLKKGAVVGREESAATLAEIYIKQNCFDHDIQRATEQLCRGNEDLIAQFEYSPGETLLHLLYNTSSVENLSKMKEAVRCTKLLLRSGVDHTKKVGSETALDVLLHKLIEFHDPKWIDGGIHGVQHYSHRARILSASVQVLLPVFKGKPPGDVPPSLMNNATMSFEQIFMEFITQLQLVLDNGVYVSKMKFKIKSLNEFLWSEKHTPCAFCVPVVRLLFTVMRHETDEFLLKVLVDDICFKVSYQGWNDVCQALNGQKCTLSDCCLWEYFYCSKC